VTRTAPGTILEIETPAGQAYFQAVRHVPPYGTLIRVLPGTFSETPDLVELAAKKEQFYVFFPVESALRRGIVRVAARPPASPFSMTIPIMRSPVPPDARPAQTWWLWDGEREWRTTLDDPLVRTASDKATVNDTYLIHRIMTGWRPEDDPAVTGQQIGNDRSRES